LLLFLPLSLLFYIKEEERKVREERVREGLYRGKGDGERNGRRERQ